MWGMVMGYGRRWSVETAFSTYKRLVVSEIYTDGFSFYNMALIVGQ
jgi:hypothetical protein